MTEINQTPYVPYSADNMTSQSEIFEDGMPGNGTWTFPDGFIRENFERVQSATGEAFRYLTSYEQVKKSGDDFSTGVHESFQNIIALGSEVLEQIGNNTYVSSLLSNVSDLSKKGFETISSGVDTGLKVSREYWLNNAIVLTSLFIAVQQGSKAVNLLKEGYKTGETNRYIEGGLRLGTALAAAGLAGIQSYGIYGDYNKQ